MHNGSGLRDEDLLRHLADLATRSYEGATSWPDRLAVFHRVVQLLDPVIRGVFAEAYATFLEATGEISRRRRGATDTDRARHREAELHQRIYEGRYPVMPVAVRKYGRPAETVHKVRSPGR